MIIILDGYNILKRQKDVLIGNAEREAYIKKLMAYSKKKGHTIVLVFDGGPHLWPSGEWHGNVYVVYAGEKESADTVIVHYIYDNKGKIMLLVTSDRAIIFSARLSHVEAIDGEMFGAYMTEALRQQDIRTIQQSRRNPPVVYKMDTEVGDENIDTLMQQYSHAIENKDDDENNGLLLRANRKRTTLSKGSRSLLQLLKKL